VDLEQMRRRRRKRKTTTKKIDSPLQIQMMWMRSVTLMVVVDLYQLLR